MQSPKMILADEPIASLDPLNAQIVMDALKDINEQEGITVMTNLHTLDTARAYCERVIGMAGRQGRVRRQAGRTDHRSRSRNLRIGRRWRGNL
jgi:phosphonate transport system ATP-binding protein